MEAPPLRQITSLLAAADTLHAHICAGSVERFLGLFIHDGAEFPLHQAYAMQGASILAATSWDGLDGAPYRQRSVEMRRTLQGAAHKVTQQLSIWALKKSCYIIRIRTCTPEWAKAKPVTSIEYMLISQGTAHSAFHASIPASKQVIAPPVDAASAITISCCFDVHIERSGIGMFIPVDYARKTSCESMRKDRQYWLDQAQLIVARLPPAISETVTPSPAPSNTIPESTAPASHDDSGRCVDKPVPHTPAASSLKAASVDVDNDDEFDDALEWRPIGIEPLPAAHARPLTITTNHDVDGFAASTGQNSVLQARIIETHFEPRGWMLSTKIGVKIDDRICDDLSSAAPSPSRVPYHYGGPSLGIGPFYVSEGSRQMIQVQSHATQLVVQKELTEGTSTSMLADGLSFRTLLSGRKSMAVDNMELGGRKQDAAKQLNDGQQNSVLADGLTVRNLFSGRGQPWMAEDRPAVPEESESPQFCVVM